MGIPGDDDDAVRFSLDWADAQGAVSGYIHGLVPDHQAADELVQEVAVAAFRGHRQRLPTASFTGWALGIARNVVRMRWRAYSRSRTVFTDPALIDSLAALNAELDDELEAERAALRQCLQGIHGRAFEILRLHYYDGLPAADIATRLALAAGHVRVQLHRLRGILRDCITRRLAGGPGHG
jgi:RNA polymerase sigma-70 factor, ECF subfamily